MNTGTRFSKTTVDDLLSIAIHLGLFGIVCLSFLGVIVISFGAIS